MVEKKSKHAKTKTTKINPKQNQKKITETNNPNQKIIMGTKKKKKKRNHPLGFLSLGHFISQVDGKVQRS